MLLMVSVGCTKTLKDNKNIVTYEKTGQTLTANILCQPEEQDLYDLYKEYDSKLSTKIDDLPKCKSFSPSKIKYESLWESLFVKPLAFIILKFGYLIKNMGLSVMIIGLIIRVIMLPIQIKTVKQSENMKKAQPEMQKIQKKYAGKQDEESMMKQSQEMMMIYKKYNISPLAGCLFSFIQLPLFIAFYEAVQRFPAIFEDQFIGIQLGTTPSVGITTSTFYIYIIIMLLISLTTIYSFKMNMSGQTLDPTMKNMPIYMSIMIIITALFMPSALCIYWIVNNLCTILQNIIVKKHIDQLKRS